MNPPQDPTTFWNRGSGTEPSITMDLTDLVELDMGLTNSVDSDMDMPDADLAPADMGGLNRRPLGSAFMQFTGDQIPYLALPEAEEDEDGWSEHTEYKFSDQALNEELHGHHSLALADMGLNRRPVRSAFMQFTDDQIPYFALPEAEEDEDGWSEHAEYKFSDPALDEELHGHHGLALADMGLNRRPVRSAFMQFTGDQIPFLALPEAEEDAWSEHIEHRVEDQALDEEPHGHPSLALADTHSVHVSPVNRDSQGHGFPNLFLREVDPESSEEYIEYGGEDRVLSRAHVFNRRAFRGYDAANRVNAPAPLEHQAAAAADSVMSDANDSPSTRFGAANQADRPEHPVPTSDDDDEMGGPLTRCPGPSAAVSTEQEMLTGSTWSFEFGVEDRASGLASPEPDYDLCDISEPGYYRNRRTWSR